MSSLSPLPLLLGLSTLPACLPELPDDPKVDTAVDTATDTADSAPAGSAPVISNVRLDPADPRTNDVLRVAFDAEDPDGDTLFTAIAWTVNGARVEGQTGDELDGATWFDRDDVVGVTVSVNDGSRATEASASVGVANTAPSAPGVAITPAEPTDDDALACAVVTESVDPDGDTVTYGYSWTVDGVDAGVTVASVDAARTSAGETWTCSVTAGDGSATGEAGTAGVSVAAACVPALDLGGAGYATMPQYASLGTRRTYAVWLYPREAGGAIFSDGYSGSSCGSHGFNVSSGMDITIGVNGDPSCSSLGVAAGPRVTLGIWQHVAIVVDDANVSFYLDGGLAATDTMSVIDPYTPVRDLWLGVEANRPMSEIFDAALSDLAMWDRALTEDEVRAAYAINPSAVSSGLVSWWAMSEGVGTVLHDGSGAAGSGTLVGAGWTARCANGSTAP